MSLFPSFSIIPRFYCTRPIVFKYCRAPKWDGSLNIKLTFSLLLSHPLSSPALNSRSRLGLRFSWAKYNTLAVSPLFPFSHLPNSRPVSHPDPIPRRGIKFRGPRHISYTDANPCHIPYTVSRVTMSLSNSMTESDNLITLGLNTVYLSEWSW